MGVDWTEDLQARIWAEAVLVVLLAKALEVLRTVDRVQAMIQHRIELVVEQRDQVMRQELAQAKISGRVLS